MSNFSIITERTANLKEDFMNYHSRMADYIDEVNDVASIIRNESSLNFDGSLYRIGLAMTDNCEGLSSFHSALERIIFRYVTAEYKNCNKEVKLELPFPKFYTGYVPMPPINPIICDVFPFSLMPTIIANTMDQYNEKNVNNQEDNNGKTKSRYKNELSKLKKESNDIEIVYNNNTGKSKTIDSNNEKEKKEFDENKSINKDIYIYGKDWSKKDAVDGTGPKEWGDKNGVHGTMEVSVLEYEYGPKAYIVPGGAVAGIGASMVLEKAEGRAQLGDDNANAYVEGEVVVGKVGGKVEGQIGLDDKGKLGVYAGMDAEAIAVEISGKAGFKVDGVDVGVKGSVDVGVGAHANVGYKDGKIYVDAGAAGGVGGSVSIEIDVSDKVDDMVSTAQSLLKIFEGYTAEDWQNIARGTYKLFIWTK